MKSWREEPPAHPLKTTLATVTDLRNFYTEASFCRKPLPWCPLLSFCTIALEENTTQMSTKQQQMLRENVSLSHAGKQHGGKKDWTIPGKRGVHWGSWSQDCVLCVTWPVQNRWSVQAEHRLMVTLDGGHVARGITMFLLGWYLCPKWLMINTQLRSTKRNEPLCSAWVSSHNRWGFYDLLKWQSDMNMGYIGTLCYLHVCFCNL